MTDQTYRDFDDTTRASKPDWRWMAALGVLLTVGGILALLNPFIASLTAEAIAAFFFLTGGAMQIWMAFSDRDGTAERIGSALLGLVLVLFGASLIVAPIPGLVSLTILVACFFLAAGIVRAWIGFRMRPRDGWGWALASAAVSILLAILIFVALPEGALGLLGIFLGVDLLFGGAAAIAGALALRRDRNA